MEEEDAGEKREKEEERERREVAMALALLIAAAPVLDRLRAVLAEAGVENELFDQVFDGIKKEIGEGEDELGAATEELGSKLKKAFKSIAVEQLRIK